MRLAILVVALAGSFGAGCAHTSSYSNEPWIPDERFGGELKPTHQIPVMNYQPPPVPNRP
jgi:hypothetical protein